MNNFLSANMYNESSDSEMKLIHAVERLWEYEEGVLPKILNITSPSDDVIMEDEDIDQVKSIIAKSGFTHYQNDSYVSYSMYDHEKKGRIGKSETTIMIFMRGSDVLGLKITRNDSPSKSSPRNNFTVLLVVRPSSSYSDIENSIKSFIQTKLDEVVEPKKKFSMLVKSPYDGYTTKPYDLKDANPVDVEKHFNDDFLEVHEKVIDKLENDNSGMLLLHGAPGTGKTTYIRHLVNNINKEFIYISPDIASQLSNPEFLTSISNIKNKVLIIEDAENILVRRSSGSDQAVSNLLNLTDGLLGDILKFQIICTVNCDLSEIDTALTREGRLIAEYEFRSLSVEKSDSMLTELGCEPQGREMTISQIFNSKEKVLKSPEKKPIGFM